MNIKYNMPNKIRSIRESLKLSQRRFGCKIGVSGKSISAYERGKCLPSMKVLETISNVYNAEIIENNPLKHPDIKSVINEIKDRIRYLEDKFSDNTVE